MPDSSDVAQARVFAHMLAAEIASTSSRIEVSENYAHKAFRVGDPRSAAGFLGAYAIIAGVFLVIAGISVGGTADGATDSTPGTTADKEHSPS